MLPIILSSMSKIRTLTSVDDREKNSVHIVSQAHIEG